MSSRPDLLVLDLEGVDRREKAGTRALAEALVKEGALGKVRVAVRINGLDSLEVTLDLKAMVRHGVAALVVPGVGLRDEIRVLDTLVQDLERHAGLETGTIRFLPAVESPEALERAGDIAGASRRVLALVLGEKPAAALGFEARGRLALAAAEVGVAAIDAPCPDPSDRMILLEEAGRARQIGYAGKVAIHPRQVAAIRRVFSAPSPRAGQGPGTGSQGSYE